MNAEDLRNRSNKGFPDKGQQKVLESMINIKS